ncbi:MAG: beta-ketoacyl-ACP synthase II [Clostridiales bacterium]|jgi:3-oxoacyl-[acyl-carrier-protein] synthase II|nr:beta-ketoacyl-ACP synthase II [Clostridiales bacterium]
MRRVVITGLGIVSPVGNDVNTYWDNIINGNSGIDFISKFNTDDFKVKVAAEVKGFDPYLYYSEKSEIRRTDLYSQYAMAAATQAMEDSKLKDYNPKRLGVYVGSGIGGIETFVSETEKMINRGPSRISPFFIPMMIANMAAGNISIRFNAQGPSLAVVTACATSTHAIGEAFRAIKHGYADAIIAGGSEAAICPLAIASFANCMALSFSQDPKTASIPFDKRRDGFVMGEGAAVVILEDYEHAKARGAKIYAEISGYGNTSDAFHVTAPHPEAEGGTTAIKLAIEEANISDLNNIYINAHGTSTPLNDKAETKAIKNALGESAKTAMISSTKSMTGHMLGAAGAAEAIASVLAIKNNIAPPTVGYEVPDPECDLDYVPNKKREAIINTALSISLGFGGHNACIALKKYEE